MSLLATSSRRYRFVTAIVLMLIALLALGCGTSTTNQPSNGAEAPEPSSPQTPAESEAGDQQLIIYSGRNENLVGPIIEAFEQETGIEVRVRYGGTSELAAMILEEGERSPADVFFAQDAGALGSLSVEGRLQALPDALLEKVEPRFRSANGDWVGVSGRARVVAYNTDHVDPATLPDTVFGFLEPEWKGRIGWAPTNASFQSFVTALRVIEGEERAREWLEGILANDPREYPNNTTIVEAVGRGEIDAGFVNHYYLYRLKAEHGDDFPVAHHYLDGNDAGALINVAGIGILASAANQAAAERFVEFLLSETAQQYFAEETKEFPLIEGVPTSATLDPELATIETPDIDLGDLWDLRTTLELLQEVGIL